MREKMQRSGKRSATFRFSVRDFQEFRFQTLVMIQN
jgi:hypothetical protein